MTTGATARQSGGGAVLLTGATGFLGKVVLEGLLRRRAELAFDRVYVLVRSADSRAAQIRLEREVLGSDCFSSFSDEDKACVALLRGDVSKPGCDLGPGEREAIEGEITRVIHCAASVEFDLPLQEAAQINVQGALEVVALSKHFERLASLVMVSTAYVTPAAGAVCDAHEALAPLPRPARELYDEILRGSADRDTLLRETGHPNTYTLTKSIAEHLSVETGQALPLSIVRPSIISASRRFPFPGWIDSHAAFASIVLGIGVGQLRVVAANPRARADIVPCDDVARSAIEAAFSAPATPGRVTFRHATAGIDNCARIAECRSAIEDFFGRHRVGLGPRIRYLGRDGIRFRFHEWRLHLLPLSLLAWRHRIFRRATKAASARRLRERVIALNRGFRYFTEQTFDFKTAEPVLGDDFEPGAYLQTVCAGVHRHLLRQDPSELTFAGREHPISRSDWIEVMKPKGANPARRIASLILQKLLRRCTGRVTFDLRSLEAARAAAPSDAEWIIVPSHRSYFDFLILPFLFFARPELGIAPPEIAADRQFARIPVLSHLARRCGAFFLRRGLGAEDKELTRQVHEIVDAGRPVLFFIEGGRSRSREFLPPKRGLLRCLQSTGRRFNLLPVTLNYDRVPEEATFERELRGERGGRIRLRTLVHWLRRVWGSDVDLGRIHVSFGRCLSLDLASDVRDVAANVVDELEQGLVATTHHLRCFLEHHPIPNIDLQWLADAIVERGGRVVRSRLRHAAVSETIEATLQRQWKHLFRADAAKPREVLDPQLAALLAVLFPAQEPRQEL